MSRQEVRSSWDETPQSVREAVDEMLGSPVTAAQTVVGGFSPGPAVRAELLDGRTVFIKAAGKAPNPESPAMHRREGQVLAALPPFIPAPSLIGGFDDGDWVALAVEWVDGRPPVAAGHADVQRMMDVLHRLADRTSDIKVGGLDPVAVTHSDLFDHWLLLAEGQPVGLDSWSRQHLARLADLDAHASEACSGRHLVHLDVRTDNIILATDGPDRDVLVDRPGASIGAPWIDLVALLPALHLDGAPDPQDVLGSTALGQRADPDAVDAFVVALAGYFTHMSLLPPPPGLATLRSFQGAQGAIARRWAGQRLGLSQPTGE